MPAALDIVYAAGIFRFVYLEYETSGRFTL